MWSIAGVACVFLPHERWIYHHSLPITKYGSLSSLIGYG
jgi:hypothetical protein